MPAYAAYIILFIFWVAAAFLVWVLAGLAYALSPRYRLLAKSVAFAVAGTFPPVIGFQILAAFADVLVLLAVHTFWLSPVTRQLPRVPS